MRNEPNMETTLIILKPDAVQRALVGEIVARFEKKGLQIVGLKMARLTTEVVQRHYSEHRLRVDYGVLVDFMTSGPTVVIALRGREAIAVCRKMIGSTVGREAEFGTIRGDYGMSRMFNLVHASDSVDAARRELRLFFAEGEVLSYQFAADEWTYSTID